MSKIIFSSKFLLKALINSAYLVKFRSLFKAQLMERMSVSLLMDKLAQAKHIPSLVKKTSKILD